MKLDDDALDALLRADAAAGPDDAGFTQRLMARLPARPRETRVEPLLLRTAQWVAVGAMLCGLGLLWPELSEVWPREGRLGESLLTGAVLLGLVTWWSLPQSRGGVLH